MGFVRFQIVRSVVFSLCFVASAGVVGITAYLATQFINITTEKPFIIFALIVSVLSLFASAALGFQYAFYSHIAAISFLGVLWLGLAATITDRIGYIGCESLDGLTRVTDQGQPYNAVTWCRLTKATMGLSWFNFAMMAIAVVSWIRLQEEEEKYRLQGGYGYAPYQQRLVGPAGVLAGAGKGYLSAGAVPVTTGYSTGVQYAQQPGVQYAQQPGVQYVQQPNVQYVQQQPGVQYVQQGTYPQVRQI